MADLTRGITFGATEEVTNTKLHNLVDAGGITNIERGDNKSSNTSFIHLASTVPSTPVTNEFWFDTTANQLKRFDGTNFVPVASSVLMTNKSGGQVVAGDIVIIDTANDQSFTTTTTANNQDVIGVAAETIADNAAGIVITHGVAEVNMVAATTRGDFVQTSTTVKTAQSSTGQDGGTIGILLDTIGSAGLATCVLFGGNTFSLSGNEIDAITGSNSPSSSNLFLTESEQATDETATSINFANINQTATHADTLTVSGLASGPHILTFSFQWLNANGTNSWRLTLTGTVDWGLEAGTTPAYEITDTEDGFLYLQCIGSNTSTAIFTITGSSSGGSTLTDRGQFVSAIPVQ